MSELIFPAALAIQRLKSSHYANSACALAEIIDNSVDAGAKTIHVVFSVDGSNQRRVDLQSPISIAILDDGKGMKEDELRRSVQYGHTGHIEHEGNSKRQKTLGRFGVGLLSASINQCNNLNIWSWQKGLELHGNQMRSNKMSVDVKTVVKTNNATLPDVTKETLPFDFEIFPDSQENPVTGTLVEWKDFHNLSWKMASTLRDKVKAQCGRVYRNYIVNNRLKIFMLMYDVETKKVINQIEVPAIDPMFLRVWDDKDLNTFSSTEPMFEPFRAPERQHEDGSTVITRSVRRNGEKIGEYRLIFSHRKIPQVVNRAIELEHKDPGNAPFGKLADEHKGVSILREGRELKLDPAWLRVDVTIDRWIKASIDFDSSLDEIFGVTNNKQEAIYLANLASISLTKLNSPNFDGAQNEDVLSVAKEIKENLAAMRTEVRGERKRNRTPENGGTQAPEDTTPGNLQELSRRGKARAQENHISSDDQTPNKETIFEVYKGTRHKGEDASVVRPNIVLAHDIKVDFVASEGDLGAPIFDVREKNGMILVIFNQDHPLYARILDILPSPNGNDDTNGHSETEDIQKRLDTSIWVIQRLFYSFARAEREALKRDRDEFQQVRFRWGRVAKDILKDEDD